MSHQVALLARIAGTSYFVNGDQIGHSFYGVGVEVWPIDRLLPSLGGFA